MVLHKEDVHENELMPGVWQRHCLDKPTCAENVSMGVITLEPGARLPEHYHIVEDAMIGHFGQRPVCGGQGNDAYKRRMRTAGACRFKALHYQRRY